MPVRRPGLAAARKSAGYTQENLAEALHIDRSTIIRWEAGDYAPLPYLRPKLARLLRQTPDQLRGLLTAESTEPVEVLSPNVEAACTWLDTRLTWKPGKSADEVAARLAATRRELPTRRTRRARVTRNQITNALKTYYETTPGYSTYTVRTGDADLETSILTRTDWQDLRVPLTPEHEYVTLERAATNESTNVEPERALDRLAEVEAAGVRLTNDPLYRLLNVKIDDDGIHTTLGVTDFLDYALTLDLLENELLDAIAEDRPTTPGTLPLRDKYLPTLDSITDLPNRLCVGGIVALCAIAREPRNGSGNYALLLQERSTAVVNAPSQRTVIPKGFHQPLTDDELDAPLRSTLIRELEEELFGRADVDSTAGSPRTLSPLHETRSSAPMRWLQAHPGRLRLDLTAFGLNLVSGNYEFACAVTIEDPDFWRMFAAQVETNWESSGLKAHTVRDTRNLANLTTSNTWNNEGLFALATSYDHLPSRQPKSETARCRTSA